MKRIPRHPFYIVSKGRAHTRLTMLALERMGVPFKTIVEAQEYDDYAKVLKTEQLLVLPQKYLDEYDTFWREKKITKPDQEPLETSLGNTAYNKVQHGTG